MSEDTNVRISPTALKQLRAIKGQILIQDNQDKSIRQIIEEMVDKCHSSLNSSIALKDLSQVEE